ncbi:uncharacterized protein [Amphiura filiformis]|uniref:uncharacterized protein n=1 Tax=Amphiura filiformis TaxID=82378 RepID=UPI003B226C6E
MAFNKAQHKKGEYAVEDRRPLLSREEKDEFTKHVYRFENLALEGGGSKGGAYVGAIRVLEEIGVWKNIRRFSGASVGAIVSMWAALGYDSYEIAKMFDVNLSEKCYDAFFGRASLPYNMLNHYGWHPGNKLMKWLGEAVAEKLGHPDATFADLYAKTGRELCIVVVNVNELGCLYCHVKTTPDMPIRIAAKMSSAIPGVVAPVRYIHHGTENLFCDGGLICNYPIHVYDGWYLSMKPKDNFLRRIPDLNDAVAAWDMSYKFGSESNKNTIGMLLYSEGEQEIFKVQLRERLHKYTTESNPYPDTKLARERANFKEKQTLMADKHKELVEAMMAFVTLLRKSDIDDSGTISRDELKNALGEGGSRFSDHQKELLFGKTPVDDLFDSLDKDGNGEITVLELTAFAEQKGMAVRKLFRGFESRKVTDMTGYFDAVVETLLLNMKRIFIRGEDLHRTIGIDTAYVDTLDFGMESADKQFLTQQGKLACMAFLRDHLARNIVEGD